MKRILSALVVVALATAAHAQNTLTSYAPRIVETNLTAISINKNTTNSATLLQSPWNVSVSLIYSNPGIILTSVWPTNAAGGFNTNTVPMPGFVVGTNTAATVVNIDYLKILNTSLTQTALVAWATSPSTSNDVVTGWIPILPNSVIDYKGVIPVGYLLGVTQSTGTVSSVSSTIHVEVFGH